MNFSDLLQNFVVILIVFYGTAYLAYSARNVGLYEVIAKRWFSKFGSRYNPLLLTFVLAGIISLTTDNDDVILTLVPVLIALPAIEKNPRLLIASFVAANTFSLFSLISNPTNIIAATSFEINFPTFITQMTIPALIVNTGVAMTILWRQAVAKTVSVKKEVSLSTKQYFNLALLIIMISSLALQSIISVDTWLIIFVVFAMALVRDALSKDAQAVLKALPRGPGLIIAGGFLFVAVMQWLSFDHVTADLINTIHVSYLPIIFFFLTLFLSVLIVNIPATLFVTTVALQLDSLSSVNSMLIFIAIVLGSNLSALLHPRATLAGQLFIGLVADKIPNIRKDFRQMLLRPAIASVVSATVALVFLQQI